MGPLWSFRELVLGTYIIPQYTRPLDQEGKVKERGKQIFQVIPARRKCSNFTVELKSQEAADILDSAT